MPVRLATPPGLTARRDWPHPGRGASRRSGCRDGGDRGDHRRNGAAGTGFLALARGVGRLGPGECGRRRHRGSDRRCTRPAGRTAATAGRPARRAHSVPQTPPPTHTHTVTVQKTIDYYTATGRMLAGIFAALATHER